MAIVGSGNVYGHPTKQDRIERIRQLDNDGQLKDMALEQLSMKDLYDIELRLEIATGQIRGCLDGQE